MSPLDLTHSMLRDAAARIVECAKEIETERAALEQDVVQLTGSGWTGQAARDFAAGMRDWDAGARDILSALETMGHLVRQADAQFASTDALDSGTLGAAGSSLTL